MKHFADRLLDACRDKGAPICVGLDPVWERLPAAVRQASSKEGKPLAARAAAEDLRCFCEGVLEAIAPHAPVVKLQAACFERYSAPGVEVYHQVTREAQRLGMLVIGDAKRGDIGISAEHYAAACLGQLEFSDLGIVPNPDALTVNAYLGTDGIQPFVDVARRDGKGVFALVRTSNPGGDALQTQTLAAGGTVAEAVARMVADLGGDKSLLGHSGYSVLGAVVGATKKQDIAALRRLMPQQLFLLPGYGAQGAGAEDVKAAFRGDGSGALVTASRSVIFAYEKSPAGDWQKAVEAAARQFHTEIAAIL